MPSHTHKLARRPPVAAATLSRSVGTHYIPLVALIRGTCSFFACAAPLAASVNINDTGTNSSILSPPLSRTTTTTSSPSSTPLPPAPTPVPTPMEDTPEPPTTTATMAPPSTQTPSSTPPAVVPSSPPPATSPPPPPSEQPTMTPPPTATTKTPTQLPTQPPTLSPPPKSTPASPPTPPSSVTSTPVAQDPTPTASPPPPPPQQQQQQQQQPNESPSGTQLPSSEETVVAYNSTTLPPNVDANVLDGGELVSVETKATTRYGHTSVSYTIVVKKGDQIEIVQQAGFNTTDSALSTMPPSSATAGPNLGELSPPPQQNDTTARNPMMNSGAVAGLALGALFIGLLISGVLMRRRNKKPTPAAADKDPKTGEESYASLETAANREYRELMNRTRNSSFDVEFASSIIGSGGSGIGAAVRTPGRQRSSLWEDSAIVAARIPFDKVEVGKLISRGGHGEVYKGVYRDQIVAVKRLLPETRKDLQHIENFLSEIKLQATLDHPHIVAFLGVAWESLSELYAISEFMDRGDLRSLLLNYNSQQRQHTSKTSPPQGFNFEKVRIALHVAHALTYLHSLQPQVLHRDLKSRNILLSDKLDAKLTDFGSSRIRADSQATMTAGVGSSLWMAPEVMIGHRYDEKSDIFSLGVVLSELDTHELPYANTKGNRRELGDSGIGSSIGSSLSSSINSRSGGAGENSGGRSLPETAILQLVSMGKLQVKFSHSCQPEMEALARKCINVDPRERPTAAEVLYQLHIVLRMFETM